MPDSRNGNRDIDAAISSPTINDPAHYHPKHIKFDDFQTLIVLCDYIIPNDERSTGAVGTGCPQFIDMLMETDFSLKFVGHSLETLIRTGIQWLDQNMVARTGVKFVDANQNQQVEMLDLIADHSNSNSDLFLGVCFFTALKIVVAEGFFTSVEGVSDLEYCGNKCVSNYMGCPPKVVDEAINRFYSQLARDESR